MTSSSTITILNRNYGEDMKKEELINMIRLVEEDLTQQARNRRTRDYFDGVRHTANAVVSNLKYYDELLKDIIYEGDKLTHCRDCIYYNGEDRYCCNDIFTKPNGYCSYGEKGKKWNG